MPCKKQIRTYIVGTPPVNSKSVARALSIGGLTVYQTETKFILKINLIVVSLIDWYSYWNFTCWYTANTVHNKTVLDALSIGYNHVVTLVLCVKPHENGDVIHLGGKFVNYPYQPIIMSGTTDELSKVPTKMPAESNEEDLISEILSQQQIDDLSNENDVSVCANCGKEGSNLNICNKCKEATYCNAACKKKHRSKHKKQCERRVAELHDEGTAS